MDAHEKRRTGQLQIKMRNCQKRIILDVISPPLMDTVTYKDISNSSRLKPVQQSCMLYCCGSKDEERERADKEDVLLKGVADPSVKSPGNTFASGCEMYGTAGMPELLPPSGVFQPSPHLAGELLNQGTMDPNSHQQRLGRRAPKLGQIGRSKRVVIEDEDLDDIMNNNGSLLLPISHSPA